MCLLFILLSPLAARANQSAIGWCMVGNQKVLTSGLNSTTLVQASYPQCTVIVSVHGGGLATIFSDNNASPTPLGNPFFAQGNGMWQFYGANGHYDITLSGAGFPQPVTYSDVILFDCTISGACSGGGGGGGGSILVNGVTVNNANLVNSPTITFNVAGNTITPVLVPGTLTLDQILDGSHFVRFPYNTGPLPIVSNGNFEDGVTDSDSLIPPAGWTSVNVTVSYETVAPCDGAQSIKVIGNGSSSGGGMTQLNATDVLPGDIFQLNGIVRSDGVVAALIAITFLDKTGTGIGPLTTFSASSSSTSCTPISVTATAPAGSVEMIIQLAPQPFTNGGTAWFDAISAYKINIPTAGGTVLGTGTPNTITKWLTTTTVGNSSATDDGTTPTRTPNGVDTASRGYNIEFVVDTGGVVANKLVCRSSIVKAVICPAGTTTGVLGVAQSTVGAGGTVEVTVGGFASVVAANTFTAGHWLVPSATVAGDVDDTGSATQPTTGAQTLLGEATGIAGGLDVVDLLALDTRNAAGVSGAITLSVPTELLVNGAASATGSILNVTKSLEQPANFWAGPISSAFANVVQSKVATCTGGGISSCPITFSNNVGTGNAIIVVQTASTGSAISVAAADSRSNIYTLGNTFVNQGPNILYSCNVVGGSDTITVTPGSAIGDIELIAVEVGGTGASCFDQARTISTGTISPYSITTSGSVAQSSEVILTAFHQVGGGGLNPTTFSAGANNSLITQVACASSVCASATSTMLEVQNAATGLSGTQTATATENGPVVLNPPATIIALKLSVTGQAVPTFRLIVPTDLPLRVGFIANCNTSAAPAAVTGTTAETFFAFNCQIPANSLSVGSRISVNLYGISTMNGAGDTTTVRVRACTISGCGSGTVVTLGSTGAQVPGQTTANLGWHVNDSIIAFTLGSGAAFDAQGIGFFSSTLGTAQIASLSNSATVSFDTTVDEFISFSVQNSVSADSSQLRNAVVTVQ